MNRRLEKLKRELNIEIPDLTISTDTVKDRVCLSIRSDLRERKQYMKYRVLKTVLVTAALIAALATTAFAVSPAGQAAINSIITYFQNDKATEMTSMEELCKYNAEIGTSITKDGYTLTLDNVAADDNFIHVFYTIKSDSVPFYEGDDIDAAIYSDAVNAQMSTVCAIDGGLAGIGNHNTSDGYFVDNYTYKAAEKYNVAGKEIPDNFKVELFGEMMGKGDDDYESSVICKLYSSDSSTVITDEEKASIWYVSADIDKSKVRVNSVVKELNTKLPWSVATIKRVVFSPFGNQLVVTTPASAGEDAMLCVDGFALFDENDTCLDILNTDLSGNADGSSTNSLEFLKADINTKQLKFVPIKTNDNAGDQNAPTLPIGQYPLTYQVNNYGSVIVTDIRISDGLIEIDYYTDGFVLYDPGFRLFDDEGNDAEPGGKLGCTLYTDVHHETNSYTARYVYQKYSDDGKPLPMDAEGKAENLRNKFTHLGVWEQMYVELDFDNAVTVDLK